MKIVVEFEGRGALDALRRIRRTIADTEGLHQAMGAAVADGVQQHIRETKNSPNTGWWGRVADSVTYESSESGATVSVPERGAALRLHGGRVNRKPDGPALTLPSDKVPIRNKTRLPARDAGLLAFLPSRKEGTIGVLVQGELTGKTVKSGPRKGKPATRPKPGGSLLYTLREYTDHEPDPAVLPTDQQLAATARDAALDYVSTLLT